MTFVGDSVKGEYSDVGLRDEVFSEMLRSVFPFTKCLFDELES